MKTKKHTTVVITKAWLESIDACECGINAVLPLLPATLSTDPDKNIELAMFLAEHPRSALWADAAHILCKIWNDDPSSRGYISLFAVWPDDCLAADDDSGTFPGRDVWLTAQYLAAIADHIATKEGR
jgi:hypothetical protein